MKYVMFTDGTFRVPVLFPDVIHHSCVAHAVTGAHKKLKVQSAGFYDAETCHAHGVSIGLKLTPLDGDSEILKELTRGSDATLAKASFIV